MKLRWPTVILIALVVFGVAVLVFYHPSRLDDPPKTAEDYELVVAFCEEQTDDCASVTSTTAGTIFASVTAEKGVSTAVVQLETDSPVFGTVMGEEIYVRRGDTYSHSIEISRGESCEVLPCTVSVTVYIQYEPILTESITFV